MLRANVSEGRSHDMVKAIQDTSSTQNKLYDLGWEQKYMGLLIASLSWNSQSRVFKRPLNERFRCYVYNDCLGGCALRCVFFLNTTWRRPPLTYFRPNKPSFPQTRVYDCILVLHGGWKHTMWRGWQMSTNTSWFALNYHSVRKHDPPYAGRFCFCMSFTTTELISILP